VDTVDGTLNTEWDLGWWQQNRKPLSADGASATVEACVSALAQTAAMAPIRHIRLEEDGGRTVLRDSNVARVLEYPNEYQTRSSFIVDLIRSVYFTGNSYAVPVRNDNNMIRELHLMDPRGSRGVMDEQSGQVFYWIGDTVNNPIPMYQDTDKIYPARDVMHLRLFTGRDRLRGETPLKSAMGAVSANLAIGAHQTNFFTNMSRPSGVLTTEEKLNREQMKQLREAWNEQSKKMDSGGVPILSNGLKWDSMSLNSQDAQLVQAYSMTIADIARVFRVPLVLINDMTGSTFNNAEAVMGFFLSSGLGFLLDHIELELARLFRLPHNESLNFDTSVLLRSDWKARMEALGEGVLKGVYSPNEARRMEGLPAVKGGEEPRVQQQVQPLSAFERQMKLDEKKAANPPVAPIPPAPEPPPEPEKSAEALLREAMVSYG